MLRNNQLKNKYSPSEFIKNVYSLVMTKIIMPQARFIRRPIYTRGGYRSTELLVLQLGGCVASTLKEIRKH
jgi:hypothetical protein